LHYATSLAFAGLIRDVVTMIFHSLNPWKLHHCSLGFNSASNRNEYQGDFLVEVKASSA